MKTIEELYKEINASEELKKTVSEIRDKTSLADFLKQQGCDASVDDFAKFIKSQQGEADVKDFTAFVRSQGEGEIKDEDVTAVAGGIGLLPYDF